MYWLKGCPRCHGDLFETRESVDHYVSCLQCGRILSEAEERALPRRIQVRVATLRLSLAMQAA